MIPSSSSQSKSSLLRSCSLGPYMETTEVDDSTPTVCIKAIESDLYGAVDNGLRKRSINLASRFIRRKVHVEASTDGVKDFIFYAPEGDPRLRRSTPVEYVKVCPDDYEDTIVRRDHDFEISFVGLSVTPQDTSVGSNELLLYSLRTDPKSLQELPEEPDKLREGSISESCCCQEADAELTVSPTSGYSISPDDMPFIHYDPVVDGHDVGSTPNSFVPVPASKALYMQHLKEDSDGTNIGLSSVNLRFLVLEIDAVSDGQARAVGGISQLGKVAKGSAIPYLELLSMAVNATSTVGKYGLKKYAKPDHVLAKDTTFMLAEPKNEESEEKCDGSHDEKRAETYGNFLRYGYYFFLGKKVDAKLYAQTGSSSQMVPLLLRRCPYTTKMKRRDEKEFFPLTGVSYVVVKVSPGCSRGYQRSESKLRQEHRLRLENMLQMSEAIELLSKV